MGLTLGPGLHFCVVGDRAIFLDVPHDRYFCLAPDVEQSFFATIARETGHERRQEQLIQHGILRWSSGGALPNPCQPLLRSGRSLLDAPQAGHALLELPLAFLSLAAAGHALRRRGFERTLRTFTRRKTPLLASPQNGLRASLIATAFARTGTVMNSQDRCLLRSLALAHRLVAVGLRPDLVLGVKLQPFKAHCWVQLDRHLVNDREDVVRDFTPILVL